MLMAIPIGYMSAKHTRVYCQRDVHIKLKRDMMFLCNYQSKNNGYYNTENLLHYRNIFLAYEVVFREKVSFHSVQYSAQSFFLWHTKKWID